MRDEKIDIVGALALGTRSARNRGVRTRLDVERSWAHAGRTHWLHAWRQSRVRTELNAADVFGVQVRRVLALPGLPNIRESLGRTC